MSGQAVEKKPTQLILALNYDEHDHDEAHVGYEEA